MNVFKKEDLLIDILSYGDNCLKKSSDFTKSQIVDYLKANHDEEYIANAIDIFLNENFTKLKGETYRLNSEGYSRLLNHRNLKAAWSGIVIAIFLGVLSILFSIASITGDSSVEFTKEQDVRFKEELKPIYNSLNQLILYDSLISINDSLRYEIDSRKELSTKDSKKNGN